MCVCDECVFVCYSSLLEKEGESQRKYNKIIKQPAQLGFPQTILPLHMPIILPCAGPGGKRGRKKNRELGEGEGGEKRGKRKQGL